MCQQVQSRALRRLAAGIMQLGVVAALSGSWGQAAVAQIADYPNRLVRIVLPLPPGTANDTTLRMVAEQLSKRWGQPVIVENRPGASTIIGTDVVAKAPADGYTVLATIGLLAQNAALRKKLPYDALRDLTPVTQLNRQQLALYVRGDLPVHSVADLVSYARKHPGKINFATWGIGSSAHLMVEKFRVDKGAQMTHVPYKGAAEVTRAVVSNVADVGVSDLLSPDQFFKSGRLRVIGVTGPSRVSTLPNAETLLEAGLKGFEGYGWFGLFVPAGTAPGIVRKISDAVNQVQADSALATRLTERMFVTPSVTTPEEFAKIFQQDIATWASVIKATGVAIEP